MREAYEHKVKPAFEKAQGRAPADRHEVRRAMGTAVFAGMIGVTFLGLFLTPVFYVLVMKLGRKKKVVEVAS